MLDKLPNILITGTPGVGKSTLGAAVAEAAGMELISVSDLVKNNELYESFDEQRQSYIIDEDRVIDELEGPIASGGKIIEYHGSSFFPERFFDAVFVLRCDNTVLHDRLAARGYSQEKILENIECEIMNVLRDEAAESYKEEVVHELQCSTVQDMDDNEEAVLAWIQQWTQRQARGVSGGGSDGEDRGGGSDDVEDMQE